MLRKLPIVLLTAVLALLALAVVPSTDLRPAPSFAQATTPNFEPAECGFYVPFGMPVECGYLTVPADRDDPDAGTMRLHISRFRSFSETPEPDPVVYVMAGPGGVAGGNESSVIYQGVDVDYGIFLERRDFIVIDQRGAGYSEPSLNCRAYDDAAIANIQLDITPAEAATSFSDALLSCAEDYSEAGIDLTHFSTQATVEDLEDLRIAFNLETWNLYGIGYGTQPALQYAATYPDTTRSLIVSSPVTDSANWMTNEAERITHSLDVLIEGCSTNIECAPDFLNLQGSIITANDILESEPVVVQIAHPITGFPINFVVDGSRFVDTVKWSMLFSENILFMPFILDTASLGSYQFLVILGSQLTATSQLLSEGVNVAIMCQEAFPFSEATSTDSFLTDDMVAQLNIQRDVMQAVCTELDLPIGEQFQVPAIVDVPVLVMGGGYDHISLREDIDAVANTIPQTQVAYFPDLTYDVLFSWDTCPQLVVGSFLTEPTTPISNACLTDQAPINFISIADMLELQGSNIE